MSPVRSLQVRPELWLFEEATMLRQAIALGKLTHHYGLFTALGGWREKASSDTGDTRASLVRSARMR
jgi:hypothetical protein